MIFGSKAIAMFTTVVGSSNLHAILVYRFMP